MDEPEHQMAAVCRLCLKPGYFHIDIFADNAEIIDAIQCMFQWTVRLSLMYQHRHHGDYGITTAEQFTELWSFCLSNTKMRAIG